MRAIVAGYGFLGREIARLLLQKGYEVDVLCRRTRDPEVTGIRFTSVDLSVASPVFATPFDAAIFCLAPGTSDLEAYERTYVTAQRNFLSGMRARYYVYISSTAVYSGAPGTYAEKDGSSHSNKARILMAAEAVAGSHECPAILRLAGLYGPARPIYRRSDAEFKEDKVIHFIHRDDAARAVLHAIANGLSGIYNVHDGKPMRRSAILKSLGASAPAPGQIPARVISHEKFFSTGFNPTYADYFAGTGILRRRD